MAFEGDTFNEDIPLKNNFRLVILGIFKICETSYSDFNNQNMKI